MKSPKYQAIKMTVRHGQQVITHKGRMAWTLVEARQEAKLLNGDGAAILRLKDGAILA